MKLETFPTELLWQIVDELDDVSKMCLRSTNSYLRNTINVDHIKLSRCSKWLLSCRFETDYFALMQAYPRRMVCAYCKLKIDHERFNPENLVEFLRSDGAYALRLLLNKPVERLCIFHVQQLFRATEIHDFLSPWTYCPIENYRALPSKPSRRIKSSQLTCLHCCEDVEKDDMRPVGCAECKCDVCPRARQPRFNISSYDTDTDHIRVTLSGRIRSVRVEESVSDP